MSGLRHRCHSIKWIAGFTLIEIIVVLVILGLALTIFAGFVARGHTTLDVATGADGLANTLRLARARAIARQETVVFTVTAGGHGYVVDGQVRVVPETLSVSMAGTPVIRFAPDGSSSGGAVRLIAGAQTRTVRVDWLSGRVSVGVP
jgi:general secretion pathway protein H